MKYPKKLVQDYLSGVEINDYDIDELEDNPEFMEQAIIMAHDYKLYDLCGEVAKRDYHLVKTLMATFADNAEFITKVATYYLKKASIDLEEEGIIEINLLLLKYLKDYAADAYVRASFVCHTFYLKEQVLNEKLYLESTDENFKDIYGKGFIVTVLNYPNSELIKDYVAQEMAYDIFEKNKDFCLENYLHDTYTKEQIVEKGINNIIVDYLNMFDSTLADYISVHIKLVSNLKKRIEYMVKRWDYFAFNKEAEIYEGIMDIIDDFCNEFTFSLALGYDEVIYFIGTELNIMAKLKEYNEDFIDFDEAKVKKISRENLSFYEYANLMDLKKKIQKILKNGAIPDPYIDEEVQNAPVLKLKVPKTQK